MGVRAAGVGVLLVAVAWPAVAVGQPAITIEVESPVLLPGESTVVRLWAGYGGFDYAMCCVDTSLLTSVGGTGWGDARVVAPMSASGSTPGVPSDRGIGGIIAGQIHSPIHFPAIPTNPIAFWEATYTAPLDAAAPFEVDLFTDTLRYNVYIDRMSGLSEPRLAELAEGAASIRVIPAPGVAVVLGVGMLAMGRRR